MTTEWTLATLKEHLETRAAADHTLILERLASRDKALELQAIENNRRLSELNHEHARVAEAQRTYVSMDTFTEYRNTDEAWKAQSDRTLLLSVPRTEFQTYKDVTERALTLKAGQSIGIGASAGLLFSVIATAASLAAIMAVIFKLVMPR